MGIAAVVVTFNRSEKLERSIRAIYAGNLVPDSVFVVNNCSTDDTLEKLGELQKEFETLHIVNTRENMGGAGGFFVGLKAAYDYGASSYWIMDDDAYAESDALARLAEAHNALSRNEDVGFLCSRVNWTDGEICAMNQPVTTWDWMRRYSPQSQLVKVRSCSFVSCFFTREILEEVGLPIAEFFIWFDDQEFTFRVSEKYSSYAVMNSIVVHDLDENKGVSFQQVTDANLWKYKYGAANESWFQIRKRSFFHWLLFWAWKNWDMQKGKVSFGNRVRINLSIFRGSISSYKVDNVQGVNLEDYIH